MGLAAHRSGFTTLATAVVIVVVVVVVVIAAAVVIGRVPLRRPMRLSESGPLVPGSR